MSSSWRAAACSGRCPAAPRPCTRRCSIAGPPVPVPSMIPGPGCRTLVRCRSWPRRPGLGAGGRGAARPGRDAAGPAARRHGAGGRRSRTGLIIASAAAGVCEQVREQFGFPADIRYPAAARVSSLHAVIAAAAALQAGELRPGRGGRRGARPRPGLAGLAGAGQDAGQRADAHLRRRSSQPTTRGKAAVWWCWRVRPTPARRGFRCTRRSRLERRAVLVRGRRGPAPGLPAGGDRSRGGPDCSRRRHRHGSR